jgi:dTMP kinase
MDALTEVLLVFAARRDHLVTQIEPALARGVTVLCDRFTDATFAYQGGGRGFDPEVLHVLESWVQAIPGSPGAIRQPDLTIWFDLDPAIAAARLAGTRVPDKFEAQPVEFFRRVAAAYGERMAEAAQRFACVNAARQRDAVWQDVLAAVKQRGWLA